MAKLKECNNALQFPKTVILCQRKEAVSNIYKHLKKVAQVPHMVTMFHASLREETKKAVYTEFSSTTTTLRCLVATIAFGLVSTICIFINGHHEYIILILYMQGIDIPDISLVVVYGLPKNLSQFYQVGVLSFAKHYRHTLSLYLLSYS